MKCDVCLEKLEEYLDGELAAEESSQVQAHLITCTDCSTASSALMAEQEMYSTYDREFEVPVSMWEQIAERTAAPVMAVTPRPSLMEWFTSLFKVPSFGFSMATAAVLVVIAIILASAYMGRNKGTEEKFQASRPTVPEQSNKEQPKLEIKEPEKRQQTVASNNKPRVRKAPVSRRPETVIDQFDVVSTDLGYMDMDDQDTANHLEQAQNLLRSIRNVEVGDGDQEIDVSYDKALSRRLLNENIVLRREAEMKAKFPAKELLSDLEPFLIDIANLPDRAKSDDVRVIKERVKKTEIVAALIGY